jgi:transposase
MRRHELADEQWALLKDMFPPASKHGRLWGVGSGSGYDGLPWDGRFPSHRRIVIDGLTFVHWYDCLTDLACGITSTRPARSAAVP